jgi:cytoskeletal protein RodZ
MAKKKKKANNAKGEINTSTQNNDSTQQQNIGKESSNELANRFPLKRILLFVIILLLIVAGWFIFNPNNENENSQELLSSSSSENNSSVGAENSDPNSVSIPSENNNSQNQSESNNQSSASLTENNESSKQNSMTEYSYTATRGDSLTLLARRAMLAYLQTEGVNLNNNQKIYAETNIVIELGSYPLNIGQQVTIPTTVISKWVESAETLPNEAQQRWSIYAAKVNY